MTCPSLMRPTTTGYEDALDRIAEIYAAWKLYRVDTKAGDPPREKPIDVADAAAGGDENLACALLADGMDLAYERGLVERSSAVGRPQGVLGRRAGFIR